MSDVHHFGAEGDGQTDDTGAIRHALEQGDGLLRFARGTYRITETIEIDLASQGPIALEGAGGTATIVMTGPGPAFRIRGTHQGTASPRSIESDVWQDERMPTVTNLAIRGAHAEADGIETAGTVQATFQHLLLRNLRHGIHIRTRARNVLISGCHIYHNRGAGIFIDNANLHQINIAANHISYNRIGGIRITGSEVRNLQITGNDIEYNNNRTHEPDAEPTAELYIDTTASGASVNEITIASNTIQATPTDGGANIRILNRQGQGRPPGLWAITGNVIGNQHNNVHLTGCHGIIISGNTIYSCAHRNLLIENSSQINATGNHFRRHTKNLGTGVRFVDCHDCLFSSCFIEDETDTGQESGASLLEIVNSQRMTVASCQLIGGVPFGLEVQESTFISITGCTILEPRSTKAMRAAVHFSGPGTGSLLSNNTIAAGTEADIILAKNSEVQNRNNLRVQ